MPHQSRYSELQDTQSFGLYEPHQLFLWFVHNEADNYVLPDASDVAAVLLMLYFKACMAAFKLLVSTIAQFLKALQSLPDR